MGRGVSNHGSLGRVREAQDTWATHFVLSDEAQAQPTHIQTSFGKVMIRAMRRLQFQDSGPKQARHQNQQHEAWRQVEIRTSGVAPDC